MKKTPQPIVKRAELLYKRGYKLQDIAERLGVSVSALSTYKQDGDWENGVIPAFSVDDIIEDAHIILFEYMQKILHNEETDNYKAFLNLKNAGSVVREMEDLRDAISDRNAMLAMEGFMVWVAENITTDELKKILNAAQTYHDLKKDALTNTQKSTSK